MTHKPSYVNLPKAKKRRNRFAKGYRVKNCCVKLAYEIIEAVASHEKGVCIEYEVPQADCFAGLKYWIRKRIEKDDEKNRLYETCT